MPDVIRSTLQGDGAVQICIGLATKMAFAHVLARASTAFVMFFSDFLPAGCGCTGMRFLFGAGRWLDAAKLGR